VGKSVVISLSGAVFGLVENKVITCRQNGIGEFPGIFICSPGAAYLYKRFEALNMYDFFSRVRACCIPQPGAFVRIELHAGG
jgi:hypothetical protein